MQLSHFHVTWLAKLDKQEILPDQCERNKPSQPIHYVLSYIMLAKYR